MRRYHFSEFGRYTGNVGLHTDYRVARITQVNEINGTVNIKWMDHPGGREGVQINQAGFGDWVFPVVNSVVLIGIRDTTPEILRYIPLSYKAQVASAHVAELHAGEKLFMSYREEADGTIEQDVIPTPTGAFIKMDNLGQIILSSGGGDKWTMNQMDHSVTVETMTHHTETEAGILTFGVAEREYPSVIPGQEANLLQVFKNSLTGEAYTEFRLRVLDVSDADVTTKPEVDDPFIELILGTKLEKTGGDLTTSWKAEQSDEGKDIAISLVVKKKEGLGDLATRHIVFNFIVDKEGNVKMVVDGNCVLECDDIKLGGSGVEQPVVLKSFITNYYNNHQQIGNLGVPTGSPIIIPNTSPGSLSSLNTVSKSTEVE